MFAWQFCKAQYLADRHGWTRFATMQNHYNLLNREEEREMLPLCLAEGVGVLPWSPLARGRLARAWDASTERMETDDVGIRLYGETADADKRGRRSSWRGRRPARCFTGTGCAGVGAAAAGA